MILRVGVVLLPDTSTESFVRGMSRGLSRNNLQLGWKNSSGIFEAPHSHISLFHLMVHEERLQNLYEAISQNTPPSLARQIAREVRVAPTGWCFLECRRSRTLIAVQRAVLKACDHFRAAPVPISWQKRFTEKQVLAYARWGYPNVGIAWEAHFSFGILPGPTTEQRINIRWRWHARSLAIVRIGNNGTATDILMERELTIN